jgi:hypothetical protein
MDQTQHAPDIATKPLSSLQLRRPKRRLVIACVLHTSPHTAEPLEKGEVSKKFHLDALFLGFSGAKEPADRLLRKQSLSDT